MGCNRRDSIAQYRTSLTRFPHLARKMKGLRNSIRLQATGLARAIAPGFFEIVRWQLLDTQSR